jgi:ubiquinone/menaquinone biosynthesis C-methylase UbiE
MLDANLKQEVRVKEQRYWTVEHSVAVNYQTHVVPNVIRPFAERLLEAAAPQPGDQVLDLACGTGEVSRMLASRVGTDGSVVGVDPSVEMLEVARALPTPGNVSWEEAYADNLPVSDDCFDLVVCHQGMQFFPDKAKALQEIRRVLKPEGRFAVSAWRSHEYNPVNRATASVIEELFGHFPGVTPGVGFGLGEEAVLRPLLEDAGFRIASLQTVRIEIEAPTAEEYLTRQWSATPSAGVLAEHEELRDQAFALALEKIRKFQTEEGFRAPMETMIVVART